MTAKLKIIPRTLVLPLALAVALLVSAFAFAQPGMAHRDTSPLVGGWRMTSLEVGTPGNLRPVPYSGQIIFTRSGTMSVQAMNPDPNAADTPYTINGYEAFYGTVAVNKAAHTFVVTVESSAVRSLIGQRLTRVFRVSGDRLVLTPADPAEGWRVTSKRFGPPMPRPRAGHRRRLDRTPATTICGIPESPGDEENDGKPT